MAALLLAQILPVFSVVAPCHRGAALRDLCKASRFRGLEWLVQIASGKVVGGRIELDSELPEGASVTVLARDGDETFEADAETEQRLLDAIAQCDRGDTIPLSQLLGELRDQE